MYVALQEACAVAVFDLDTETITSIKPLQAKSWKDTNAGLDASNKDNQINMQKWPIYGMLMPDTVQIYTAADGIEYLVTANEGDDKEYIWGDEDDGGIVWTEMIRGKDIAEMVTPVRGTCASTCTCATDGVASCGGAETRRSGRGRGRRTAAHARTRPAEGRAPRCAASGPDFCCR